MAVDGAFKPTVSSLRLPAIVIKRLCSEACKSARPLILGGRNSWYLKKVEDQLKSTVVVGKSGRRPCIMLQEEPGMTPSRLVEAHLLKHQADFFRFGEMM